MTRLSTFATLVFGFAIIACNMDHTPKSQPRNRAEYAIALHGGAGAISRKNMSAEMEKEYREALEQALQVGERILQAGGAALDAVTETVMFLEDHPLFNAGRGAVFTYDGHNELDASIMRGSDQAAGAAGGLRHIKNPIRLARLIMEKSPHVMLTGQGAEQFAREQGLDTIDPRWFYTETRWQSLQKLKAEAERTGMLDPHSPLRFGTVGCVALDKIGHLAAATSTGGMTGKRWNRIGDSPIIGAGTYADDAVCAVSCTGHGEFFIRYAVAHDLWAAMAYRNMSLRDAAQWIVNQKLVEKGGEGGLIAVDASGNIAMPFNSDGMYRAFAKPGERGIFIYQE